MTKVNGKLQQPDPGRTSNDSNSLGMKFLGEEPRPAEVFAESKGNTEWIVEEGGYKCQLRPHDQLQRQEL